MDHLCVREDLGCPGGERDGIGPLGNLGVFRVGQPELAKPHGLHGTGTCPDVTGVGGRDQNEPNPRQSLLKTPKIIHGRNNALFSLAP